MSVIERIMKAYVSKHDLKPEHVAKVRGELSAFIDELMSGTRPEFLRASVAEQCALTGRSDQGAAMKSLSEQHHIVEAVAARASPVTTVKN